MGAVDARGMRAAIRPAYRSLLAVAGAVPAQAVRQRIRAHRLGRCGCGGCGAGDIVGHTPEAAHLATGGSGHVPGSWRSAATRPSTCCAGADVARSCRWTMCRSRRLQPVTDESAGHDLALMLDTLDERQRRIVQLVSIEGHSSRSAAESSGNHRRCAARCAASQSARRWHTLAREAPMKTEQLVDAAGPATARGTPRRAARCWPCCCRAGIATTLGFALLVGLRPDLAQAAAQPCDSRFKVLLNAALWLAATGMLLRLARPGASRGSCGEAALWAVPVMLAVAACAELALLPRGSVVDAGPGQQCRHGACASFPRLPSCRCWLRCWRCAAQRPCNPARAGAMAGLMSAGLAGTLYALHCPDDSPLFVGLWYVLASASRPQPARCWERAGCGGDGLISRCSRACRSPGRCGAAARRPSR